ncbi:MAG TPA: hypothetical protein VHW66_08750 [Stellaceae bacterium]|jgi:hypothetical protein|nr:hypothetical protein [Stellaceae bacterium]
MSIKSTFFAAAALPLALAPAATFAQSEADMQRVLREQVRYQNGLLVFRDKAGVTVAPATIAWTLDCGEGGVGVTLGSGTGDTENGLAISLGTGPQTEEQCQTLAPSLGAAMLAITRGN